MWRTILLGKLSISILASLVVGGFCLTQPWRHEYTFAESTSWIGIGIFFLVLGIAQIAVTVLLTKTKK
jgi:hypothetical protein